MQLSAILAETRTLLDDNAASSSNYRWSDADLKQYINDAQYEFNQLTQIYKRTDSVALVNGTATYTFPNLIGPILRVETSNTRIKLTLSTEERLDVLSPTWLSDASTTLKRFVRSKQNFNTIRLNPIPTGTAAATYADLVAYGVGLPATLSGNTDVPAIPASFHQALPYGAAYRAFLRNQDAESLTMANLYKTRFMEFVQMAGGEVSKVDNTLGSTISA